jgi:hypothetical protein
VSKEVSNKTSLNCLTPALDVKDYLLSDFFYSSAPKGVMFELLNIQCVSGGIVNILGGGSMDYSE